MNEVLKMAQLIEEFDEQDETLPIERTAQGAIRMTDNQVGAICALGAFVVFMAIVALRMWIDRKEEMRPRK